MLSANLVLSANALVAGASYTFSLTATYSYISDGRRLQEDSSSSSTSSSLATISILANTPPTGGMFEVSPGEGEQETMHILYARVIISTINSVPTIRQCAA